MSIPIDKQGHAWAGAAIAAAVLPLGPLMALVVVCCAAVGKELLDDTRTGNKADLLDAVATMVGGLIMVGWQLLMAGWLA